MKLRPLLLVTLALCACGSDLASPFSAVAVTYDVNKQAFKLAQVRVATLTSLRHLEGSSGDVRTGGTVKVSTSAINSKSATVDSLRAAFITQQPSRVSLTWNVLNDIVYAEDFESLELLSTYYNVEKARTLMSGWWPADVPFPQARSIVAHASLSDENNLSPLPAGELYYAPLATFYAPAATPQQAVPAALNLGAVAHALGHEAVQDLIWGGRPAADPELGSDIVARHVARSMAEGIGDYLGVAVSDDPRWFDHSLQIDQEARALDQIHCATPDMLDALATDDSTAPYDPYPLGSVIAGALWEEASASTAQNTSKGLLSALPDLGARAASGALGLADVIEALAAHSPDDQRTGLCAILFNRFAAVGIKPADLPSCPKVPPRAECQ